MLQKMSESWLIQGGALAHTANASQQQCLERFFRYWMKGEWSASSPDLNPIKSLWGILHNLLDEMDQDTMVISLIEKLKKVWKTIPTNPIESQINGRPSCMKLVIDRSDDYIYE